jgi:glycosyltransferase involved in cell wall biosynthesis
MKLTYIANIRFPTERAHGIQIMSMAQAFAESGAEVKLLVSDRKTHITEEPFHYYGVKKVFTVEQLKTFDLTHYGRIFRALAYHIERVTFTRSAVRYAKAHREDIFFTRDELTFVRFTQKNIPIIFEMHTMPQKLYLYRDAFRNARKIVAITEHLKSALVESGVPAEKIVVAADGVNLDAFENPGTKKEAREHLRINEKAFVALYVGLLDEWKGYRTILEASSELHASGIQCLLIGGNTEQIKKLKKEFPNADFLSFIPYAELPLVQQAADVLLIPNSAKFDISRLYTSPLKLFTYMTSGIPIVASDLPSLREIVDEQSVVFFKPDNAQSLIEAVKYVKNNPYKIKLIAENAKELVKQYSWENRARKILETIV